MSVGKNSMLQRKIDIGNGDDVYAYVTTISHTMRYFHNQFNTKDSTDVATLCLLNGVESNNFETNFSRSFKKKIDARVINGVKRKYTLQPMGHHDELLTMNKMQIVTMNSSKVKHNVLRRKDLQHKGYVNLMIDSKDDDDSVNCNFDQLDEISINNYFNRYAMIEYGKILTKNNMRMLNENKLPPFEEVIYIYFYIFD